MISGTLTGLFFKSTSGVKKCARGGLVSVHFQFRFKSGIWSYFVRLDLDWVQFGLWVWRSKKQCSIISKLTNNKQDQRSSNKTSLVTTCYLLVLSCMNVISRVFRFQLGPISLCDTLIAFLHVKEYFSMFAELLSMQNAEIHSSLEPP